MNDEIYFIKESEYPEYVYWTTKLNFVAKEYDNSLNFWNVIEKHHFHTFMEKHYGVKIILDTYNYLIGVKVTNPNKKLLLDLSHEN